MRAQAGEGHDVSYFFAGRHYPKVGPRLRRWRSGELRMFELLSTRIHTHWTRGTRHPLMDLAEPTAERAFASVLQEVRPDVVHAHELAGLPSSVLAQAKAAGAAVVMTMHDYTPLCASVRLVDADGGHCLRREVGED
ncbi:MAG: glycosyltransferase, partial [Actinomycetota bacterium]|nr:glycosyltransferase [Actinomycetota bacterium]